MLGSFLFRLGRLACATSAFNVVDAELLVTLASSPFGMGLTFFRFAVLTLLVAFRLTIVLVFDARDLSDFMLDAAWGAVDSLASRYFRHGRVQGILFIYMDLKR
jgi:hypothetical protein